LRRKKNRTSVFGGIRQFHKLQTTDVKIIPIGFSTTPKQVIDFAKHEVQKTVEWEAVYCVFDRDEPPTSTRLWKVPRY
jgi:hypothetical protein